MNKAKPIKITYEYIGDKYPEKRKRAEQALERFYDEIFTKVAREMKDKKLSPKNQHDKTIKARSGSL